MKKRLILLSVRIFAFVSVGLCYYLWYSITGIGIPCLFYKITGLMCPGCGVTRLCLALLKLDFHGAFKANPAIFCLLPVWLSVFSVQAFRYVKYGKIKMLKWQEIALYFSAAVLILFGITRNIPTLFDVI